MTRRSPRVLLALTASAAVLLAACSGGGATTTPSRAPSAAGGAGSAATSAPASAAASAQGGTGSAACPTSQPAPLPAGQTRTVTINTSKGTIVIKVEGKLGPIAGGNFVALAACGYYDNVVFHRLVPGFVIQAGDGQYGKAGASTDLAGNGGPGYTIADEPVIGDYTRGTVAMARTSQPHSQGSQFFICLDDLTQNLDKAGGYVILGHVTSGMEAVDAIATEPNTGPATGNKAITPEPMTKVTVATP